MRFIRKNGHVIPLRDEESDVNQAHAGYRTRSTAGRLAGGYAAGIATKNFVQKASPNRRFIPALAALGALSYASHEEGQADKLKLPNAGQHHKRAVGLALAGVGMAATAVIGPRKIGMAVKSVGGHVADAVRDIPKSYKINRSIRALKLRRQYRTVN